MRSILTSLIWIAQSFLCGIAEVQMFGRIGFIDPDVIRISPMDRGYRQHPDDFNISLDDPNQHTTRIVEEVSLKDAVDFEKNLTYIENGFEFLDFNDDNKVYEFLNEVARTSKLSREDKSYLRTLIPGKWFVLNDDTWVIFLLVSKHGTLLRQVGPNGEGMREDQSDRWVAMAHGDQQNDGLSLFSLVSYFAHLLKYEVHFPIAVLNLWFPVQSVQVQPLVIMDSSTLYHENQLRYHIFNKDANRINDCWSYTYNQTQEWWSRSDWQVGTAALFSTFRTPHSSATIFGEELISSLWRGLRTLARKIETASKQGSLTCSLLSEELTANEGYAAQAETALESSIPQMIKEAARDLLEAHQTILNICSEQPDDPTALVQSAKLVFATTERLARKSVEMRTVALVISPQGRKLTTAILAIFAFYMYSRRSKLSLQAISNNIAKPEKVSFLQHVRAIASSIVSPLSWL